MIYCHIPFCRRKCTYCAFYSLVGNHDRQRYVEAVCREIVQRSTLYNGQPIKTVYFGGGTPSQLQVSQLSVIIDTLKSCFDLSALQESTIEANPDDLSIQYLEELSQLHFFNRISIGVQSFDDNDLLTIGRSHDSLRAIDAINAANQFGFDNITMDLIYGLPNQSVDAWIAQLEKVANLPVDHLSCYALTVEPKTILDQQIKKGIVKPVDESVAVSQYEALCAWMSEHNWEQYEVSNFCRDGKKSLHNSRYWNRSPYWGFGAAAHSFDGKCRRWNVANIQQYCNGVEQCLEYYEQESLSQIDAFNEYIMTTLRTNAGVEKTIIRDEFPRLYEYLHSHIQPYVKSGLIVETSESYRPTMSGLLHADGIAAELFLLHDH